MMHRFSICCLLAASLLAGCVQNDQQDDCSSDNDCRLGRTCNTNTGMCVGSSTSDPIGSPDASDEPDATEPPDAPPTPDAGGPDTGGLDTAPRPDAGEPDTTPEPDIGACTVEADIRARPQGGSRWVEDRIEVQPLQSVEFDASQSRGDIISYEWSFLSHPQGSTQRFLPQAFGQHVRVFTDLAGTYEVQLTVEGADDAGRPCTDTDVIEVTACACDDLHIQLTWDTPGDPDQTDGYGSDLDLHYKHSNGNWQDLYRDVYWRNPNPDWGLPSQSHDDPSLDIDSVNGRGPENITHSGLENQTYRVGVYHFGDDAPGNFEESYATLRIYLRGQLVYEKQRQEMSTNDFWDVATIEWPSGTLVPIDRITDGFPSP